MVALFFFKLSLLFKNFYVLFGETTKLNSDFSVYLCVRALYVPVSKKIIMMTTKAHFVALWEVIAC